MTVPYGRQWIDEADVAAVTGALRSELLTQGPRVAAFEHAFADWLGVPHAVAVANGTAALHLACVVAGLGGGDGAVTSPITFLASANCAVYCGARPSFADVDPERLTLDPAALEQSVKRGRASTPVRVVIPVHLAGQPADMEAIYEVARRYGLVVIEDAAHALGATFVGRSGATHRVGDGSFADLSVFSFHPVKHVTTGEGGMITTNNGSLAARLRDLRNHGIIREPERLTKNEGPWYYEMHELGFNYRITDIQCALGLSQLRRLDEWLARRRAIAARYDAGFADLPAIDTPTVVPGTSHAFHLYVIRLVLSRLRVGRLEVFEALRAAGLGVQVHYIPVHLQPYYRRSFGYRLGDFPVAEQYYERAISLPMFPKLTDQEVDRVIDTVRSTVIRFAA